MLRKQDVSQFGRGLLMGSADVVPGVSGGTVALVLGIYARLVTAISRFDTRALGLIRQGRFADAAAHVDLRFLVALGAGIATAILTLSSVVQYLLHHQRQHTYAAFFGLILGSTLLVARLVPRWNTAAVALLIAGACGAFWFVGLAPLRQPPQFHPGYLFLCGFFAICAMILPGVSGAFLLVIFGAYSQALELLRRFKTFAFDGNDVACLVAFVAGMAGGLLAFTKVLRWLLGRYESATLAALAGFMIGSLRKLWPYQTDLTPGVEKLDAKTFAAHWPNWSAGSTWISLAVLLAAVGLVVLLEVVAAGITARRHERERAAGRVA